MGKEDPDFLAIRIGSLAGDRPITFDTYVKVGSRHVLYCRNGDVFDMLRLSRLKAKSIESLYIQHADRLHYHMYLQQNVEAAYGNRHNPIELRARVIIGYNCDLIDKIFASLGDMDVYIEARSSSRKFEEFIVSEEHGLKALFEIGNPEADVAHHGVRVAALAIGLAEELNLIDNKRPVHLLGLGCFVHDLEHGLAEFDYRRPVASLSKKEMQVYKDHPRAGAERIQQVGHYDPLVQQFILQHEEHADGSGFPKGLTEDQADPLIWVGGIANAFDRLVTFEKQSPKDALKSLLIHKMGAYPLPTLQGMQNMLKRSGIVV